MKHQSIGGYSIPYNVRPYEQAAVIGAGAWGTALAMTLAHDGSTVRLWGRNAQAMAAIAETGRHTPYLDDIIMPDSLEPTAELAGALRGADVVLIVVPSNQIRAVSKSVAEHIGDDVPVAICAKGVEAKTGLLMTQVAQEELGSRPVGCISGPTFARETALCHPTAATVAFPFTHADRLKPAESPAARLSVSLSTGHFRAYISDDLVGVEIGGAVKNVIAIACGMMTGAGFTDNTRAALITGGVDEMKRLAQALGGRRETLTGLAGVGDLTLTCNSTTSRNMSLGHQLGSGLSREACFDGKPVVVEGEMNAISITDLARSMNVDMPICETVRRILHDGHDLGEAFAALWARPIEAEPQWMDVAFTHPASDQDIADLAERIS